MIRAIATLLSVAIAFYPTRVLAQPPASTTPAPSATAAPAPSDPSQFQLPDTGDILPLRRGQAAPQDGLLVDAHDLLSIQQEYERMRFMLGLTHDRDVQLCDIRVQEEQARTHAAEERLTLHDTLWTDRQQELVAAVQAAQQQAQRAAQREWFESPPLWAAIGVVLATVVFVAVSVR